MQGAQDVRTSRSSGSNRERQLYTAEEFCSAYGLQSPAQWLDVCALKGDPSDNIPGVAGVGVKTALKLVQAYGSLQGVLDSAASGAALPGVREPVRALLAAAEGRDAALFSAELIQIDTELKCLQDWDLNQAALQREAALPRLEGML